MIPYFQVLRQYDSLFAYSPSRRIAPVPLGGTGAILLLQNRSSGFSPSVFLFFVL